MRQSLRESGRTVQKQAAEGEGRRGGVHRGGVGVGELEILGEEVGRGPQREKLCPGNNHPPVITRYLTVKTWTTDTVS